MITTISIGKRLSLVLSVLVLGIAIDLSAQDRRVFDDEGEMLLSAQVVVPTTTILPDRPTQLVVPLIWRGRRLLQGHLHYNVYFSDPDDPLVKMVSPELTLDTVPRELRPMLPKVPGKYFGLGSLSLGLKFIENGTGTVFDLGTFTPLLAQNRTVAVVSPNVNEAVGRSEKERSWWATYRPDLETQEEFRNQLERDYESRLEGEVLSRLSDAARGYMGTRAPLNSGFLTRRTIARNSLGNRRFNFHPIVYPAFTSPSALPGSIPELNCFDAVFLQDGVGCLSTTQRSNLTRWVRLGGKVLVRPLESEQGVTRAFLEESADGSPLPAIDAPVITTAGLGQIMLLPEDYQAPTEEALPIPEKWLRSSPDDQTTTYESPTIPKTFYTGDHISSVDAFWQAKQTTFDVFGRPYTLPDPQLSREAFELLAPKGTDALPIATILLCLGLFLLAAGPVDYFFLGLIHRRGLTWILYPAAAVVCTWAIVSAANARRSVDGCGKWRVVTFDTDGTAMSEVEFQLHVANKHSTLQLSEQGALVEHLMLDDLVSAERRFGVQIVTPNSPSPHPDWLIEGTYPTRYKSTVNLPKWTPKITRTWRPYPNTPLPEIDWESIDPWERFRLLRRSRREENPYAKTVVNCARTLASSGQNIHCTAYFNNQDVEAHLKNDMRRSKKREIGIPQLCIQAKKLSDDLARVAFTIEDGNQFTTYVRLFRKPDEYIRIE